MAFLNVFVPLQRVPAQILNAIQRGVFDQRGNGAGNTLTTNLDNQFTGWNCGRVQMSIDRPVAGLPLALDSAIDWRDRQITVAYRFDPLRDIRPGRGGDQMHARDRGLMQFYTGLGTIRRLLGPSMNLFIGPTGVLFIEKGLGYAYVEITTSTQLKERS